MFLKVLTLTGLAGLPGIALAQIDTCPLGSLTCTGDIGGYFESTIFPAIRIAFMGVLAAVLIITAMKMMIASFNESTVSEARIAYLYSFIGTFLVLAATTIAATFVTESVPDITPAAGLLNTVSAILRNLLTICFIINIVIQAVRLIVGTEESARESAKKNIVYGMFGAFIVVLADAIVQIFFNADAGLAWDEIYGVVRFLATILGALLVIGIIVAGIFLVVSVTDSVKERAKSLLFACIITLIIMIAAYGIVTFFIF